MATKKVHQTKKTRSYLVEYYVNFRPSPQTMRELEEMWNAWGESRTSTILRAIHTTYLLWKNDWNLSPNKEYKPLKVIEE